jgi:ectoine hydroxylase-related dioxygenase (phytanoyl-CoA dioxygenase family)/thioesterase domain-containing protein/4-hydroxybenzoate polyprenyltransferase
MLNVINKPPTANQHGVKTEMSDCLIPIKPSGSKRPFFYVHGADGHTIDSLLSKYIDSERPFYGLRALGRDGKAKPHTSVEEMAAYYIREIQMVQPEGAYLLGGRCTGGTIALEMAQQLKKKGQDVLLVVMVDSPTPLVTEAEKSEYRKIVPEWKERWKRDFLSESSIQLSPEVFDRNILIPVNYELQQYSGKVVYFSAQDNREGSYFAPDRWNRTIDPFQAYRVPGDHMSMTKEPNIRILASKLSRCLDDAELTTQPDSHSVNQPYLKQDLERKGYTVSNFLNREEVQHLLKLYQENPFPEDAVTDSPYLYRSDSSSQKQYREQITQEVKKILDSKIKALFPNYKIFSRNFICKQPDHLNVPLHQDPSVVDEDSQSSFIMWCPLIDVDEHNGCLQVVPKSHLVSSALRPTFMATCKPDVLALMKQNYLVDIPMKAGAALIFNSRLFHSSNFNLSNCDRLVISCCIAPQETPLYFYYHDSEANNRLKRYKVDDQFYDQHRNGSTIELLPTLENLNYDVVDNPPNSLTPEDIERFMKEEQPEEIKKNPKTQKNIRSLFNLLRGQDWWFYKIPPLLAIAYAEILTQDIPPHPSFTTLLALTVSMFCVAAYGHVVNDIFDVEVDKKAGKPNRMASLSRGQQTGLSLGLAVLGLIPWWWIGFNPTSGILLAAIYLLLTVYPAPPLRLKERLVFGAVADAATVHAVPTLLVATVFANLAVPSSPSNNLLAIIATAWAFAVGIRGILLHQIWDRENDLKSGIQTLATKLGVGTLRFWINSIVFPLEAILSTALVLVIAQSSPFFLVPCAAYGLMLLLIGQNKFNPSPPEKSYIVLHDFYEVWLPLSLLILLSLHQPTFLILLGVHIALFYPAIQQRVLVSIRQIKLNLAKMNISQSHQTVEITDTQPQPETFLLQPANDLERSLVRAVEFLTNNQLEDGEFPTYEDADEKLSKFDSSPFATSLILYSLSFLIPDDSKNKVKHLIDKGLHFLRQEIEFGGLWRYWSSKNQKHLTIPPDLDDISCISYLLRANNISFTDNTGFLFANQNKIGAFYTWILPRSIKSILLNVITFSKALSSSEAFWTTTVKDDVCCAVNSNVLLYLGERKETQNCIKYLIEIIQKGKEYENTEFYLHNLSFYYMLSRAYYNGVKSLSAVKTLVVHRVLGFQQSDGSFGDELLTALGVCTLLNFNYLSPRLNQAITFILSKQNSEGDWKRIAMFGGKTTQHFFGSEALTTGFCVEALARYRLLNIPATQRETSTILIPQMQQELEENGYVILNNFLSEAELQDLREFDSTHPRPEDIANGTTINTSDLSYRQQVNQKLTSIVSTKLPVTLPGYRTAFCTWYRKSPNSSTNATPLHQAPSLTDETDTRSYGIWCPLTDVTPENGCLSVVKGSHHLNSKPRPFYPFAPFPYDSTLASLIQDNYLTPIPLKAGQAILYDKRLFHSATANPTDTERVAFTCLICPSDQPSQFVYRPSADTETIEIYQVPDDFYNRYILGERPSGDGVTLIQTAPYTCDPLTPELIAEKLDPLHPDRAIPRLKTQLAEQHRQHQTELDALQQQLDTQKSEQQQTQQQLQAQLTIAQTELEQTTAELTHAQADRAQLQTELEAAQQHRDFLHQELEKLQAERDNLSAKCDRQALELEEHRATQNQAHLAALIQKRHNANGH